MIQMSLAIDQRGMIGSGSELPWNFKDFPEDMKHFRKLTLGKTVIMGRGSFESLGSKPLPGRKNVVITSNPIDDPEVEVISRGLRKAINRHKDCVLIGGHHIYMEAIDNQYPDEIFVTLIENTYVADIPSGINNISLYYNLVSIKSYVGEDIDKTPYHIMKYIRK